MNYIKGFDSLRAISIIFVMITHLGLEKYVKDNFPSINTNIFSLINGSTGVRIFFVLSGFLITSILLSEKIRKGNINFRIFYIRRFLRLLPPLIIFFSTVYMLMKLGYIWHSRNALLFSFFYLYNFVPNQYYTGELGHTWSLAVEEQFYFTWPFIINYVTNNKKLIFLGLWIIVLCALFAYSYPHINSLKNYKPIRWFFPAVGPIILGCILATVNNIYPARLEAIISNNKLILIFGLIIFISPIHPFAVMKKISFLIQSFGVCLFLIWIYYNQESILTNFLENRLLSYIGKISYGLYLYQGIFLRTGPSGILAIQQFPLNIFLTFIVAIVSYEFIERPILRHKKRFR